MANAAQEHRKRLMLKHWREVLPGVPDDQIVLPRHTVSEQGGFPKPPHGQDDPFIWESIRYWMYFVFYHRHPHGSGRNEPSRKSVQNLLRRAERWWDSLRNRSPLLLNQKLFSHRDYWRDIFDFDEFQICLALCNSWLNLPDRRRSAANAKRAVRKILREMRDRVEAGLPPPEITPIANRGE